MLVNNRSRRILRLQNISFVILYLVLIVFLAVLTHRYNIQADWTSNQRNTLTPTSAQLLSTLDKPLQFTVYATEDEGVRDPINLLINRYRRENATLEVEYINPELEPALIRELGIANDGEVVISYGERNEKITEHSEQAYTNAIQRLARSAERWLVFLSGHGERNPLGQANHDLQQWATQLQAKGIRIQSLNLTQQTSIPDNTAAIVIASPQVDYLSGEIDIIKKYIEHGGNLLWLTEPNSTPQLQRLTESLPVKLLSGTVVDPSTQLFGISDPRVALVTEYPRHKINENFDVLTLYPQATALEIVEDDQWQVNPLLRTLPRSWAETGTLSGEIEFNQESDIKGPLTIGVALTRNLEIDSEAKEIASNHQQRIVIIGDGDFLSNTYLGNGGNLDFGLHIVNWLTHDDQLIDIAAKTSTDIHLELSPTGQMFIAFGFLLVLPLILAASGFTIWWKRRKC